MAATIAGAVIAGRAVIVAGEVTRAETREAIRVAAIAVVRKAAVVVLQRQVEHGPAADLRNQAAAAVPREHHQVEVEVDNA